MNSIRLAAFVAFAALGFNNEAWAVDPTAGVPAEVKALHLAVTGDNCETDLPDGAASGKIDANNTIYLVPCMMGAYQGYSYGYIVDARVPKNVSQVMVLEYDSSNKSVTPVLEMTSAVFAEKTGILSTFAKGRGLGDCGQSSRSEVKAAKYGGISVRTIEIRNKDKCDGKDLDWPVVFKQK